MIVLASDSNITFDIYRGYNASNPYPADGTKPVNKQPLGGYLRHQVKAGKFGYGMPQPIFFTHLLFVAKGTDARDAYKSQLGFGAVSQGDTILVSDYLLPNSCQAFLVVFIQELQRGTPDAVLQIFLDRAQPRYDEHGKPKKCPHKPKSLQPSCCPGAAWPDTLYATLYAEHTFYPPCTCLDGAVATLIWDDALQIWLGSVLTACGDTITISLTPQCEINVISDMNSVTSLGTQIDSRSPAQLDIHCQMSCQGTFSAYEVVITQ
jgi:hypothetical protein